jgi:hypothetical protein
MPGITGTGTTFDLPNFVGDLFSISPEETPLLSAIGGLTGGRVATDVEFGWSFYDLRDPDDSRQKLEGADAPDPTERVREDATNVVEIHQETVSVTYTRQSVGNYATQLRGGSKVPDELKWQMDQKVKEVARDVEATFITGTYAKPMNNSTARRTRGLLEAIVTNIVDAGNAAIDEDDIGNLFQTAYANGGLQEGETRTIICGPAMKRFLTKLYITDKDLTPLSRNVGGVNLTTIETDFGTANLMLDRNVPVGTLIAVSLEDLAPRFLEVPGKGHFFWEPLAKVGSRSDSQMYGEIGLEYGNERKHAKIVDATTPFDAIGVGSGS